MNRSSSETVHGLTEQEWIDLAKRIANGMATEPDAEKVEQIGLLPQALRIRQGLATFTDAQLVHIQAGMRMLGIDPKAGRAAA